jgi:hypothetical protein
MAGDLTQHMIEEADSGVDFGLAGAVEEKLDGSVGLCGLARDAGAAHVSSRKEDGLKATAQMAGSNSKMRAG